MDCSSVHDVLRQNVAGPEGEGSTVLIVRKLSSRQSFACFVFPDEQCQKVARTLVY